MNIRFFIFLFGFILSNVSVLPQHKSQNQPSRIHWIDGVQWAATGSMYLVYWHHARHLDPLFDEPLLSHSPQTFKTEIVDYKWLMMAGGMGVAGIFFSPNNNGFYNRKTHDHVQGFTQSILANFYMTELAKITIGRKRPSYEDAEAKNPGFHSSDFRKSFWSGHASTSFNMATYFNLYLWKEIPGGAHSNQWKLPLTAATYGLAAFVAVSRVLDHTHHASDVIVGGFSGTVIAALVYSIRDGHWVWNSHDLETSSTKKSWSEQVKIKPILNGLNLSIVF